MSSDDRSGLVFVVACAVIGILAAFAILNAAGLQHWSAVHFGILKAGPDPYYNFWSGSGSDIAELALLGGMIQLVRHLNCHNHGCWRIAKHTTPDGYKLCRHCVRKPKSRLTLHDVHEDHR